MRPATGPFLSGILRSVNAEIAEAQARRPEPELRRMVADAPPLRSLREALSGRFGLIAEIKERSPSLGRMIPENVAQAPAVYEKSPIVRAFSILTNRSHFGMGIERLLEIKKQVSKPVLRKEFILSEYQILEARAFGADAILLMASILGVEELASFATLAAELGMDVLFECHSREEIGRIPDTASLWGINCRKLDSRNPFASYGLSKFLKRIGIHKDLSIGEEPLELINFLPKRAVKVAESGMVPGNIAAVRDRFGYHAALVGNSLLSAREGIEAMLGRFETALSSP